MCVVDINTVYSQHVFVCMFVTSAFTAQMSHLCSRYQ